VGALSGCGCLCVKSERDVMEEVLEGQEVLVWEVWVGGVDGDEDGVGDGGDDDCC